MFHVKPGTEPMKITTRDDLRVVAVFRPTQTHTSIASLGFTDRWGEPLEGNIWGAEFEFTVLPRRLGDLGAGMSVSDTMASRDVEGDYYRRCEIIREGLVRHPNVTTARIECDETHTCSLCGHEWEELTADQARIEFYRIDDHSIAGEPVCCGKAIEEFRTEREIPLPTMHTT